MENHEPAYPTISDISHNAKWDTKQGMSVLDYFAGQALPIMMQHVDCKNRPDHAAHHAYRYAAAMLEARKAYIK